MQGCPLVRYIYIYKLKANVGVLCWGFMVMRVIQRILRGSYHACSSFNLVEDLFCLVKLLLCSLLLKTHLLKFEKHYLFIVKQ